MRIQYRLIGDIIFREVKDESVVELDDSQAKEMPWLKRFHNENCNPKYMISKDISNQQRIFLG